MDPSGAFVRLLDDSLTQIRELPQLQSLRIAPLRQPVSSRILSVPSPLEPNASGVLESNNLSKANASGGNLPAKLPTLTELLNAARTKNNNDSSVDSLLSLESPPKPILPAFVNLRALERFPYSSFHEDGLHIPRKRRRVDAQADSFGEHLQLPIPQAQKEQRPPPFGPFAILNGLNEPPPNAALLPPIEPGSITRLLTKPTKHGSVREPAACATKLDTKQSEKREGRIEEILDTPIDDKEVGNLPENQVQRESDEPMAEKTPESPSTEDRDEPISPKTRGRSRKNLRKWTEEETTALLRGVVKCGIGNWTAILAQPELKFNKRSAANLKDRFRVCCPWAYQASDPNEATRQLRDLLANALSRAETDGPDGKIILPDPRPANSGSEPNSAKEITEVNSNNQFKSSSSKKSNARKKCLPPSKPTPTLSTESKSTLASLGIPEPHFTTKSRRRSRCPFTPAEDEALLKGYAIHGFQWTLIQQDKRLNLGHRKATHLRDRFRTKFPHSYRDGGPIFSKTQQNNNNNDNNNNQTKKDSAVTDVPPHGGNHHQATRQIPSLAHSGSSSGNVDSHNTNNTNTNTNNTGPHAHHHRHRHHQSIPGLELGPGSGPGPIDPALAPPAPPQRLLETSMPLSSSSTASSSTTRAGAQFPALDDNPSTTITANSSAVDGAGTWGDNNTLPPMVWDDLS